MPQTNRAPRYFNTVSQERDLMDQEFHEDGLELDAYFEYEMGDEDYDDLTFMSHQPDPQDYLDMYYL
jgi:hypothetical protein